MIARVATMCREDTVAERKLQRALEIVPAPRKLGLKGMVSKRKDTPYRSGRSGHWLKMKNRARESGEAGGGKAEGGRELGTMTKRLVLFFSWRFC
jgi:ATP-dependent DNA ligase